MKTVDGDRDKPKRCTHDSVTNEACDPESNNRRAGCHLPVQSRIFTKAVESNTVLCVVGDGLEFKHEDIHSGSVPVDEVNPDETFEGELSDEGSFTSLTRYVGDTLAAFALTWSKV
uniref:Uncharacterized protein n=1 Tax=Ceratitis capitata TaxID=7213 RepID=W8BP56_CERCA